MQTIIILSADYREGRRFAADAGYGMSAIVPVDASRLQGLRPTAIIELPSFARRRDRHAMESMIRFSDAPRMLVDPADYRPAPVAPESVAKAEPLPGDEVPGQTTIDEQVALAAADRLAGVAAIDLTAGHSSPTQVVADAPKTPDAVKPPRPTGYKPRSRKRT